MSDGLFAVLEFALGMVAGGLIVFALHDPKPKRDERGRFCK